LKVENGQPVLYLTEDFKIEYVHAVTETQTNPQTGQQETVVVRRRITSPLAGAVAGNLAGQAIGSLLDLSANSIHLMLSYLALYHLTVMLSLCSR